MIRFEKYHGTGNDFIFVYDQPDNPSECAIKLCDRHYGIGADGLMYASPSTLADIKMSYYNADGSHATMCGNGLRCFARFVTNNQIVLKNEFIVETDAGLIPVNVQDNEVSILLNRERSTLTSNESIEPLIDYKPIKIEDTLIYGVFVGTLHGIVFVEDYTNINDLGPKLTYHPNFLHAININFVRIINHTEIEVRTHERGAGWTLSCGTGVCASVVVSNAHNLVNKDVFVKVPGGALNVSLKQNGIQLSGPAEWIMKGETL